MEDDVGGGDQLGGAHGEQPGVARAGADEEDAPPRPRTPRGRPRRRRLGPREQVGGAGREHPLRERGRVRRLVHEPLRAVRQPGEPAQRRPAPRRARRPACGRRRPAARPPRARPPARRSAAGSHTASNRRPARACTARQPCPGAGTNTSPSSGAPSDVLPPQPPQPGGGQDERVDLAGGEPPQARVDVAAQLDHLEVRPHGEQLRAAPQRARADARARRQRGQRRRPDQHVARILARRHGHDRRARPRARPARPSRCAPRGRSRRRRARAPARRSSATCPRRPVARRRPW